MSLAGNRQQAPGRIGAPELSLGTDPRADQRMVAVLAQLGMAANAAPPAVPANGARADQLAMLAGMESGFEQVYEALFAGLEPIEGLRSERVTIEGTGGNAIELTIDRPAAATGPLPCVFHIHGGGMVIMSAAEPSYIRLRQEIAVRGAVAIGVEFRNGAGKLGAHPYPAGFEDCKAGVRWAISNLSALGGSGLVVAGDSGGGNLALAVALAANREGWAGEIAGVHVQCPFIHGRTGTPPPELTSLRANDGYFLSFDLLQVMAEAYDPGGSHAEEATCWPYHASEDDMAGLPPHVISVNELDPVADEGIAYYRRLVRAGVAARAQLNLGLCHTGDIMFPAALPDVYAAAIDAVVGFARSVVPAAP
ncbi:alpha/beta hydrolase fold domain-containing protein [Nocardia harenae]|uniref:alpha/beta hydrolase fold domain-containing protein n=1 Tax=Nocardia harenae TaxID=358707 RepID=UPI0008312CAE|nr:alpha/beta hydrolase fold domain-containing protein [Nocardia harenae]